jgi:hypothetical protein
VHTIRDPKRIASMHARIASAMWGRSTAYQETSNKVSTLTEATLASHLILLKIFAGRTLFERAIFIAEPRY